MQTSSDHQATRSDHDEQQVSSVAFQLWDTAGRPQGRDQEFWYQAEKQIQKRRNASPTGSSTAKGATQAASSPPSSVLTADRSRTETSNNRNPVQQSNGGTNGGSNALASSGMPTRDKKNATR
jgi:Protein of unknown function (DUF2934)